LAVKEHFGRPGPGRNFDCGKIVRAMRAGDGSLRNHGLLKVSGVVGIESDSDGLLRSSLGGQLSLPEGLRSHLRHEWLKRIIDLSIALPLLLLLMPLLVLIAAAIRMDSPGPALFRQRRFGRHFTPFVINKFRSLRVGEPDPHANYEMSETDPRITRTGHWLRRTSLDELPQIFNVIAGSMSLVGPRPLNEGESRACLVRHAERFLVRPGITGLQQVELRNASTLDERSDLDVAYVRTWSLRLDFSILLKTPFRVLSGSGIYPDEKGPRHGTDPC
jgi:lipopolysaccharide/colanic/teichoic acid biosynthesis glycosyltransferase